MKQIIFIILVLANLESISDVVMHTLYADINQSRNIVKSTVIRSRSDSVIFRIDTCLLGDCQIKEITLAQREIRDLIYGCQIAPEINVGDERILFFKNKIHDTIDKYKLLLDLKLESNYVLIPYLVYIGVKNENLIIEKNNDPFFNRRLPIKQLYEAIRIMNLCNNIDGKAIHKYIRCDTNVLIEISKTNYIIRAWLEK